MLQTLLILAGLFIAAKLSAPAVGPTVPLTQVPVLPAAQAALTALATPQAGTQAEASDAAWYPWLARPKTGQTGHPTDPSTVDYWDAVDWTTPMQPWDAIGVPPETLGLPAGTKMWIRWRAEGLSAPCTAIQLFYLARRLLGPGLDSPDPGITGAGKWTTDPALYDIYAVAEPSEDAKTKAKAPGVLTQIGDAATDWMKTSGKEAAQQYVTKAAVDYWLDDDDETEEA
jgi:hypothetical protein